jgi:hypothetical protein
MVAIAIAKRNVEAKAPSNFGSELNFRNKPWGTRSTFTCMANITSVKAMAAAPISEPPRVTSSVRNPASLTSSEK